MSGAAHKPFTPADFPHRPFGFDAPIDPVAKRSKYGAVKTVADGIEFHSAAEARRYGELKLLERAKHIRQLELQPVYSIDIGGRHICRVILDFRYWEGTERFTEDVKGKDNPLSRLKRKLVEAAYPGTKVRIVK
jgi:hypothetical protein